MKLPGASVAGAASSFLMRHLATITLCAFATLVAVGALGTRVGPLLHQERLTDIVLGLVWSIIAVSSLWLARTRPLYLLAMWSFLLAIIAHSFCNLYWPSLRPGVPIQDYLLADEVSSNYSFDQAKIYWRHMALVLLSSTAAASAYAEVGALGRRRCLWFLAAVALLAFTVVGIQSYFSLSFLSAGSGSAMGNSRAPGLLEDSGASTVYYAALVSGMIYLGLFGPFAPGPRFLLVTAAIAGALLAKGTGGRIFFVSIGASGLIGLGLAAAGLLLRIHRRHSLLQQISILGASALLIGIGFKTSPQLRKVWSAFELPQSISKDGLWTWFIQVSHRIDPIRSVHMKVMLRTFAKHPWFGTGLGSFHSNYFEHLSWALSTGGSRYPDPPASLYLMIVSELGLVGVAIILTGLGMLTYVSIAMLKSAPDSSTSTKAQAAWNCAGIGVLVSLCISFVIGSHLLFLSASSALALGIFAVVLSKNMPKFRRSWAVATFFSCTALLLTHCLILFLSAPRVPQFRWAARGKAQVPLSLTVPISTQGFKGTWLSSGAEVLYDGRPVRIFVEMPPEYYPLTIAGTFVGPSGDELARKKFVVEEYDLHQPWRTFDLSVAGGEACAELVGPEHFCSVRIETAPVWSWDRQMVGFFVMENTL